ncbi:hypothetical protein [Candidatus Tisiphia endosymbiont of Dioctria rufipes]|uniref:hypothetical protein n=1 Tax=Candidatus Tisiphia endosymbiont of Dioctria rufipes TaxID=3066255 RepID=UPI00312C88F2
MSKQQNNLVTKQDVAEAKKKNVENAKKILTAVQEKNIDAVYEIVGLPSKILQKFNAKISDAEKILTKRLSDLKEICDEDREKILRIDPKSQKVELNALCKKFATEEKELKQVQQCLNLIHAIKDTSVSIEQILDSRRTFAELCQYRISYFRIQPIREENI